MLVTAPLPLLPEGAREVSSSLAILEDDERVVFFNAAGPIFSYRKGDRMGRRVGAVTVLQQGLARPTEVAKALGIHRSTLHKDTVKFAESGIQGLVEKRSGPKGPHTFKADVLRRAQDLLDSGESIRATAAALRVSPSGLRHAIRRGDVVAPSQLSRRARSYPFEDEVGEGQEARSNQGEGLVGPSERAAVDQATEAGVGCKRTVERAMACLGKLQEATPAFTRAEAVPGAGVLLALPALLDEGLVDVGTSVYGELRKGFYGLRSVLMAFAFMALLRIKSPEQLTEHAPGELGLLLGLDRFPEVKTLRRKLRELGERGAAWPFMQAFTERWANAEPQELAVLYVDGHVRPYNGRKYELPLQRVQQRGRAMPGTKDFHVNDRRADPLLFVTVEGNEGLLQTLDEKILPEIRRLVGPDRRVTVAFDREGWSPAKFAKWKHEGFDILTYRKGKQASWRTGFARVKGTADGDDAEYDLAERRVKLPNGLSVREIRNRTEDGHQTSVITTSEQLSSFEVANRMFARWRQENFFRYMRHEFALDHLCTHEVEAADPERLIVNPKRRRLERELQQQRLSRRRLLELRTDMRPGKAARVGNQQVDRDGLNELLGESKKKVDRLVERIAKLPERVPVGEVLEEGDVVQLERERKVIVDAIKLTAYRAESALARLIEPFFRRHEDEARKFLKTIFSATADLVPDEATETLTVRFHGLSSPRATRALVDLCELVNEDAPVYPGTDLRLRFEAPSGRNNSPG